jgi:hypothetical protein
MTVALVPRHTPAELSVYGRLSIHEHLARVEYKILLPNGTQHGELIIHTPAGWTLDRVKLDTDQFHLLRVRVTRMQHRKH